MPSALHILAAAIPGFVRLGRLQLPVFGMVATAGLLAALLLSQHTAPLAGLDPNRLWDAGIIAVVTAFLASRLLLVAANLKLFLANPALVLAQPSLTLGGLLLTAGLVWLWLRRKRLPLRRVLDAWAAPAALLAAILQLGHFVEGTDAGMPTTLPWGIHTPGDLTFARVHPVQLYASAGFLALCVFLLRKLGNRASGSGASATEALESHASSGHGFSRAVTRPSEGTASAAEGSPSGPNAWSSPGLIAALGLLVGGALSFCFSFLRQPYDTLGEAWLDPAQYAALAAMLAGAILWTVASTPALTLHQEPR